MSVRSRIAALERRKAAAPVACPGCGRISPGGVILAVDDDGAASAICINCGCDREEPKGPVKAYGGSFIRQWIAEEWAFCQDRAAEGWRPPPGIGRAPS